MYYHHDCCQNYYYYHRYCCCWPVEEMHLCVFVLHLVLVGPVEVKSMRIHVQSHRSHGRQILKRKTGGTGEVTNHGRGSQFTCCSHFRRRELCNAAPACAEDSHLSILFWHLMWRHSPFSDDGNWFLTAIKSLTLYMLKKMTLYVKKKAWW